MDMIPQHIPQELAEHILRFLPQDNSTLRSCSLVSCSWTNPAQHLLFRHLRIRASGDNLAQRGVLQDFIASHPTISEYIQVLTLYGGRHFKRGAFTLDGGPELNGALLTSLLAMLPRLRELYMHCIIVSLYCGDGSKVATNEKALEVLSFRDVQSIGEPAYSPLLQLLRPISSVDSFHVEKITSGHGGTGLRTTSNALLCLDLLSRLRVRSLSLTNHRAASVLFIRAFMESSPQTIRVLHLDITSVLYEEILPMLQGVLKEMGPGCTSSHYVSKEEWVRCPSSPLNATRRSDNVHHYSLISSVMEPPDLSTLTSLRSLHFRVQTGNMAFTSARFLLTLQSLTSLPPLTFTLTYEFYPPRRWLVTSRITHIAKLDWPLLEAKLLALPRLPASLHIMISSKYGDSSQANLTQFEAASRLRLPELDAQGILVFSNRWDPPNLVVEHKESCT